MCTFIILCVKQRVSIFNGELYKYSNSPKDIPVLYDVVPVNIR
jgi:hypothetical protein